VSVNKKAHADSHATSRAWAHLKQKLVIFLPIPRSMRDQTTHMDGETLATSSEWKMNEAAASDLFIQ